MRLPRRAKVASLILATLVACGTKPVDPNPAVAQTIGPEGGQLKYAGFTLSVPQGALADSELINLKVLDQGGAEVPGRVRVSKVFLVSPDTLRFLTPATVTLGYDQTLIPAGIPERSTDVRHIDYSRVAPERLGSILVDTTAKTVSGETSGLGSFWATAPEGARPVSVTVSPASKIIYEKDTATFTAEVLDQNGLTMSGQTIAWSTSVATVAVIDADGKATGIGAGTTDVVAKVGAASGKASLQVASGAPFAQSLVWENPIPGSNELWTVRGDKALGVVVAGAHGTVAGYAQGAWTPLFSAPRTRFRALAAQGQGVVAAGSALGTGLLVHADGSAIEQLIVPDTDLVSLWVEGADGMAVGDGPNIAVRDATGKWVTGSSPVSEPLLAVDGVGGEPVVVGARGSVYQLTGGAWVALSTAPLPEYQVAAVASGAEAWAISAKNLRHFAAGSWSLLPLPSTTKLALEVVARAGNALAVSGKDADGKTFVLVDDGTGFKAYALGESVNALGGASATDLYAVGPKGAVWAFDGSSWTSLRSGMIEDIAALWAFEGEKVYAAANVCVDDACSTKTGALIHRDATGRFTRLSEPFTSPLHALGGRSADDFWALGDASRAYHYFGGSWTAVTVPDYSMTCVAVCSDALYACGVGGVLKLSESGSWSVVYPGATGARALSCAGVGLFAVGAYNVWRLQGGSTTALNSVDDNLYPAPWRAVFATVDGQAFIGGDARYLLHWTGDKFEAMDQPGYLPVMSTRAIWGTGFGNVWAGGVLTDGSAFLVHFNGGFWQPVDPGLDGVLSAISGLGGGDIWIGGESGALLHGALPTP